MQALPLLFLLDLHIGKAGRIGQLASQGIMQLNGRTSPPAPRMDHCVRCNLTQPCLKTSFAAKLSKAVESLQNSLLNNVFRFGVVPQPRSGKAS